MIVGGVLRSGSRVGVMVGISVGINVGVAVSVNVGMGDGVGVVVSITGAKVPGDIGVQALRDIRINKKSERHFMCTPPKMKLIYQINGVTRQVVPINYITASKC